MEAWAGAGIQPKSIATGAQYVSPDTIMYCENLKICRFGSAKWFFCTKFVQLGMAGKRRNTMVHLQNRV
jgi:hypothetical protein